MTYGTHLLSVNQVSFWLPDDWYYPWNHGRTYDFSLDFFLTIIYIYIWHDLDINILYDLCHWFSIDNGYFLLFGVYWRIYVFVSIIAIGSCCGLSAVRSVCRNITNWNHRNQLWHSYCFVFSQYFQNFPKKLLRNEHSFHVW